MGDDAELRLIREVALARPHAVVTGPAAAKLLGLATLDRVTVVDLRYRTSANASGRGKDPSVRYRGGRLSADQIFIRDGVAHVDLMQVLFDTYRFHGRLAALVPLEHLRFKHQITVDRLLDAAKWLPRANGIRGFEELIRYSSNTSQSPLETIGRDAILQANIPEIRSIEYQAEIRYVGFYGEPRTALVDVLINGWLVVEFDGRVKFSGDYGEVRDVTVAQLRPAERRASEGLFLPARGLGRCRLRANRQRH